MTSPSSNSVFDTAKNNLVIKIFAIFLVIAGIVSSFWMLGIFGNDPFIEKSLSLKGSEDRGERLFRINCVGCHGIKAEGLLGPDLHQVSNRLRDKTIINQIIKGKTPPMPSFELEPQNMADLLSYLETIK